jgi:DNA primase
MPSIIEEIKQKVDIIEVISQYTNLTKAGRNFRALCPFHSEKNPSFFVYPERQSWHCFGACATGGDVFSFVMKKQNIDFGEALRLLAERAGVTLPSRVESDTRREEKERQYKVNEAAAQYFHNLLLNSSAAEKIRSYLTGRGLLAKTIADFQLGFSLNSWEALKQFLMERGYTENELLEDGLIVAAEDRKTHDRFRYRLMFPIKDARGRTIGFGARVHPDVKDESQPKYINSPQSEIFDKSGSLYGIHLAAPAIRQQEKAVIVEGYMDVIIAHQYGFDNVVASMGTSVTDKQVSTLKRLTRNITLALDSDAAGEEAMLRGVGYENALDAEVKVIVLPSGKDPDEVIKEDTKNWSQLVASALPVLDYTFNMVTSKLDLSTARDKSIAADQLIPLIAEMKDVVRQGHYLQKLARLLNTSERSLETVLRGIQSSQTKRRVKAGKETQQTRSASLRTLLSNPVEEYCLALLLQHPELKVDTEGLLPDYFENSENREIFTACQKSSDPAFLKEILPPALLEHLNKLLNENIPPNLLVEKFTESVLRLREKYWRSLEAKREAMLTLEAEAGGTDAELAKLKEQGIDVSLQLGKVFTQKASRSRMQRR